MHLGVGLGLGARGVCGCGWVCECGWRACCVCPVCVLCFFPFLFPCVFDFLIRKGSNFLVHSLKFSISSVKKLVALCF